MVWTSHTPDFDVRVPHFPHFRHFRDVDYCPVGILFQPPGAGAEPVRVPAGGLCIRAIHQHGLDFLDLPRLHGEELADDAVELRDGGGVLHALDLAEAQDGEHDAALLVDHGVAAVPQVAADEAAAVEAAAAVV